LIRDGGYDAREAPPFDIVAREEKASSEPTLFTSNSGNGALWRAAVESIPFLLCLAKFPAVAVAEAEWL
jgi:hypothetical protein